jgi:hypothetical protein
MAPYLLALLIVVAALAVGLAVARACGADDATAPAIGLAVLTAVAALFIRLPGDAVTAAVVGTLVVLGVAVWYLRSGPGRPDLAMPLAAAGSFAIVSLQFLSASRIGMPGAQVNEDTAVHLLWAEGLRSDVMDHLYPSNPGYPLGPHALIAAIAQGTGATASNVLIGVLIATPALIAMTAAAVLRPVPVLWRVPAATFVSLTYLEASWFGQGAFKEPLMSLYLLGFAVGVGGVLAPGVRLRRGSLIPLGLIGAGALLTYSYLAIAWLGAAAVLAIIVTLVFRWPGRQAVVDGARAAIVPLAFGLGVAIVASAAELHRVWRYLHAVGSSPANGGGGIGSSELGNLTGPLPTGQLLSIWPSGDFRYAPPPHEFLTEIRAVALLVVVGGALYLLDRRRHVGLLAGLGAALAVWLISDRGQSPYVTAKSLVILSPFVALVGLRALLPEAWPTVSRARLGVVARLAVAAVFVGGGLWSTEVALRGMPVESSAQSDQLEALRPLVQSGPTLFLGDDDYVGYRLRGTALGYLGIGFPSPLPVVARLEKPFTFGQPVEWDSFDAATLDRFTYVVSIRSPYISQPPANFRRIAATPLYEVWRRTGPTQPRSTIEPSNAPVARLDCSTPDGRRLSRRDGVAEIERHAPVTIATNAPGLGLGGAFPVGVTLPKGTWNLAFSYTSESPIRIMYGSTKVTTLGPNTDRAGSWWSAGSVVSDGRPQQLVAISERQSRFAGTTIPTLIAGIVAVSADGERQVLLKQACGRYIDWYRAQ